MPKITFTKDYTPKDDSGVTYKEGQTVEMNEASANHFIIRNAAVLASDVKAPAKKEAAKSKAKDDEDED